MKRQRDFFISVYRLDRVLGGWEEGGWWYDTGYLVAEAAVSDAFRAISLARQARAVYPDAGHRFSSDYARRSSDYSVTITRAPGDHWPPIRPYYS